MKNLKSKYKQKFCYLGLLFTLLTLIGCSEKGQQQKLNNTAQLEVGVITPLQKNITEWDEFTGRFEAINRVNVRARVSGLIEKKLFKDGDLVQKGDVLFVLDQEPFLLAIKQAKAKENKALAMLKQAESEFNRVNFLREKGTISKEAFEQRLQNKSVNLANVQLAQAETKIAKLNLKYTQVVSTISGRISKDYVNEGNLISGGTANATLLTTIVSLDPIHFYFEITEADKLKYARTSHNSFEEGINDQFKTIYAQLIDEDNFSHQGSIDFVDNRVDQATGTVMERAIFRNEKLLIEPGMFARVKVAGSNQNALLIPDVAINTNQTKKYVYILDKNNKVKTAEVILGPLYTKSLRVIKQGITAKDKIIVNNTQRVRVGMMVSPHKISISDELKEEIKK